MKNNELEFGDKVSIHYQDIDGCGYGDSVNCQGVLVSNVCNGSAYVQYKDETFWQDTVKEFSINDLTYIGNML